MHPLPFEAPAPSDAREASETLGASRRILESVPPRGAQPAPEKPWSAVGAQDDAGAKITLASRSPEPRGCSATTL